MRQPAVDANLQSSSLDFDSSAVCDGWRSIRAELWSRRTPFHDCSFVAKTHCRTIPEDRLIVRRIDIHDPSVVEYTNAAGIAANSTQTTGGTVIGKHEMRQ